MEAGCEILEIGERLAIRGGQIEAAIIATGAPRAIRLGHKMKRRGPGAVGAADNTSPLQLGKFFFGLLQTERVKVAGFGKNRRASGVNIMLDTMIRRKVFKIGGKNSRKRLGKSLERRRQVRERMEGGRWGNRR